MRVDDGENGQNRHLHFEKKSWFALGINVYDLVEQYNP